MDFSFSSLITTLFFNSISIAFLCFLLKNNKTIRLTNIRILIMCMLLSIIKLLIPFEFFFSKTIYIESIWPNIYRFIMYPIGSCFSREILLVDILCCIWVIGMIFSLSKLFSTYILMSKYLKNIEYLDNPDIHQLLNNIECKKEKKIQFRLVSVETVSSPFIFGIINPYIVLPKNFNKSDKDLYFILNHEIAHYHNGDLVTKFILAIFTSIYWWNPFIYLLQNQITKILEINIDEIATNGWTDGEKIEYLNCLVTFAKDNLISSQKNWAVLFKSGSPFTISQRVNIMLENMKFPEKTSFSRSAALLLLSVSLFFLPIFITFEAWSINPKIAQETFAIDSQNAFYINNNDGTFDLYIDNNFVITVTEIFDSTIKIRERRNEN